MFRHVPAQIQTLSVRAAQGLKGLDRLVQNAEVRDPIHAVVGNIVILVVVADEIILSVLCRHLIRADDVLAHGAVRASFAVQLLVRAVFEIGEGGLLSGADRLIEHLDRIKQLRVSRLIVLHGADVPHMRAEISTRETLQLLRERFALAVRNVSGEQQAVDQKPQLRVRKLPLQPEVREHDRLLRLPGFRIRRHAHDLGGRDGIAHLQKRAEIAPNRLAVGAHVILRFQNFADVPLAESVLGVGMVAQNIKDQHGQDFFRRFCHHGASPIRIVSRSHLDGNVRCGKTAPCQEQTKKAAAS